MRLDFWYFDSDLQTVSAGLKIAQKNHKYSHPGAQCSLQLGTILYSSLMDKYRLRKHYELVQLLLEICCRVVFVFLGWDPSWSLHL